MDYVGSTTPLITNGGDPLSDELVDVGAAFKVDGTEENTIAAIINDLVKDTSKLARASKQMRNLQPKYYWGNVTKELSEEIKSQSKPYSAEQEFRLLNNITQTTLPVEMPAHRTRTVKSMARQVVRKTQSDGIHATYIIVGSKVRRRAVYEYRKRVPKATTGKPRIVIVSNQLNNTGAPFVIMDVVHKMKLKYPELISSIKFIAFTPIEPANIVKLKRDGVDVEVYTNRELRLEFNKGDVVVFNTFAISHTTALSAINALKDGNITKLFWYGHEHSPDGFIQPDVKSELKAYLKLDKARIYAVSESTLREYIKFFGSPKNIEKMPFPFLFPSEKFNVRAPEDFRSLRFITTGSLMDMRKGQYPVLYAFLDFYHNYYLKAPKIYRDFQLEFIGAYEKSDLGSQAAYHVKNIKKQVDLSASGLDGHFKITPSMSHEKAIEMIEAANVTICYSLFEALGIFVYEGMATGHPIIRNESAGREEQLIDGKNGYAVSSSDFAGLVVVIEKMLSKKKTSDAELVEMSARSNEIARRATKRDYSIIDDIENIFIK